MKENYFCGKIKSSQEGDFTMNYSPELNDALLRRMLPPNNESITKISRGEGISEQTLRKWRDKVRFVALYEYKRKLAIKYPMPQDSEFYMNVELMNIVMSWLLMCYKKGEYKNKKLEQECLRVCKIQTIKQAAQNLKDKNNKIADLILQQKVDELEKMILERVKQTRKTDIIKKVLSLFG